MASREQLLAEAYRRGLMPAAQAKAYEEGVRRGLVKDAYAKGRVVGGRQSGGLQGFVHTFNEVVPGADEASAGIAAAGLSLSGRGKLKDNWRLARDYQAGMQEGFRRANPVASAAAQVEGMAVQAVPFAGKAAATAAAPAAKNMFARAANVGGDMLRNATMGATVTAANVFAGRGDLRERTDAAAAAAPVGAAVGVALPAALAAPGAIKRGASAAARAARPTATRLANKAAVTVGRGPILDPRAEAVKRLGETLRADKFTQQEVQSLLTEWQRVGGPSPAFMDLISQGGRGQRTMALIRGSAVNGGGRNVAAQYGNQVAADLQDNAIARTRQLTPERRPAAEVADDLRGRRSAQAEVDYAPAYQTPVKVTDDLVDAIGDDPGRGALRRARAAAVARRDAKTVEEIDGLLRAEPIPQNPYEWYRPAPEVVSARALDRTRIAMSGRGAKMNESPDTRDIAGGLFGRAKDIDAALDKVPELAPARTAYRDTSRQIEGVEKVGPRILTETPDNFSASVDALGSGARPSVQVGAARSLEDAIGRPAEGATGVLNRIGTATNTRRNLETTFGEGQAGDYRQAINQMRDQLNNARFINPNTGSQTAGRLSDQTLVESIPSSKLQALRWVVDKVRNGVTLTNAEREALVQIATTKGGSVPLDQVFLPKPRAALPAPQGYGAPNYFALPQDQENRR